MLVTNQFKSPRLRLSAFAFYIEKRCLPATATALTDANPLKTTPPTITNHSFAADSAQRLVKFNLIDRIESITDERIVAVEVRQPG